MPHTALSSFIRADIETLRSVHDVQLVRCASLGDIAKSVIAVRYCDAVVCWFGSTRYLPLAAAARMSGRPVIIISGGYDVASEPDLDYGNMYHRGSRVMGRVLFRLANAVASISASAAREARVNARVTPSKIRLIYLGLDPQLGANAPPAQTKERIVFTLGFADRISIRRKGILTVVRASRLLPHVSFIVAGPAQSDAMQLMRTEAGENVRFEGEVSWQRACDLFAAARVYVQASRHEAFGYAVAEAMLHNCIPVVSHCGSLPEVVGNAGLFVEDPDDLPSWVEAIRTALEAPALGEQPRARVVQLFSAERRRRELLQLVEDVCGRGTDA